MIVFEIGNESGYALFTSRCGTFATVGSRAFLGDKNSFEVELLDCDVTEEEGGNGR